MRMTPMGLALLAKLEGGVHLRAYNNGSGYATIGLGHLIMDDEATLLTALITQEIALGLLKDDVGNTEDAVNKYVSGPDVEPLRDYEFDALCIFCFNVGVVAFRRSTLVRVLNTGDRDEVPHQLLRWNKANGKVSQGLINRRNVTGALFGFTPYDNYGDWHGLTAWEAANDEGISKGLWADDLSQLEYSFIVVDNEDGVPGLVSARVLDVTSGPAGDNGADPGKPETGVSEA